MAAEEGEEERVKGFFNLKQVDKNGDSTKSGTVFCHFLDRAGNKIMCKRMEKKTELRTCSIMNKKEKEKVRE